jgi:arginine:pyruvate transaminase
VLHFSKQSDRLARDSADVWQVHYEALARKEQGDDVLVLSVGDPDFPTPAKIVDYLSRQVEGGRTHYSPAGGEPALLNTLAELESSVEKRAFDAGQFTIFPGATAALYGVFATICDEGDEVIVPEPMYIGYHGVFDGLGVNLVRVSLDEEQEFALHIDRLASVVTDKTRAVLVNTPGNPCGNVMSGATLKALSAWCESRDLWLVCDEVYSLFTYDEEHVSLLRAADSLDNVIVIDSLSKSHAMSGWRIGWAVAPHSLTEALHRYCGATFFGCSQFIQDASAFALGFNAPHIQHMVGEYRRRRDFVVQRLERMNRLDCYRPRAGMFVMVDTGQCAPDGDAFARRLLDEVGVSVLPGAGFGNNTRQYVRLSLTQSVDVLAEAFDRIESIV